MSLFSTLPASPAQLAIYFSEQGTPVFPCQPSSKRPFRFDKLGFVHGFHDATTDRSKIEGAWMIAPAAMVGLPTGEISGWWVLDIDAKHCDPEEALAELEAHYGAFSTLVVKTPSGGFHVYFQWTPESAALSIFETEALPNGVTVDLRGNGGYAIAPGSRSHTGAYQVWIDRDIAAAPAELVTDMAALCNRSATFRVVGGTTSLKYQRTVRDLAEHIRNNQDWHKSQRELIAKWTAAYGVPPDEWVKLAPLFQQDGYSLEQTIKEIHSSASGAFGKYAPKPEQQQGQPGDLELVPFMALQSRDPPEFQVAGVVPEKGFGYIYGKSATFKTFVTLDLALSIAFGRAWQGRPVKPGRVLYILGEGQGAFANRIRSWQSARALDGADCPFWTLFNPIQFTNPTDIARLVAAVEGAAVAPDWVFIDTVARNFGAGDPDKTQDMTVFVNAVDAVRQRFGCGVFGVHHAGKDETKGARNSSVLQAAADFEIRTEREEGSPAVILTNTKAKDWEEFPRMRLQTESVTVTDPRTGEEVTSLVIREGGEAIGDAPTKGKPNGKIEAAVFTALTQCGTLTVGEISARTGENKGSVSRALASLRAKLCVAKDEATGLHFIPEENQ
jgi:hypothetical protein